MHAAPQHTGSASGARATPGLAMCGVAAGAALVLLTGGLLLLTGTKLLMMHLQKGHIAVPRGQRSHMSSAHSAAAATCTHRGLSAVIPIPS